MVQAAQKTKIGPRSEPEVIETEIERVRERRADLQETRDKLERGRLDRSEETELRRLLEAHLDSTFSLNRDEFPQQLDHYLRGVDGRIGQLEQWLEQSRTIQARKRTPQQIMHEVRDAIDRLEPEVLKEINDLERARGGWAAKILGGDGSVRPALESVEAKLAVRRLEYDRLQAARTYIETQESEDE